LKYIETKNTNNYVVRKLSEFIPFDFRKFLAKKYFDFINSSYIFIFDNIDSSILDFYIDKSPGLDLGILRQIRQNIKFTKDQKERISINYDLLEFPIDYKVFDINKIISTIKNQIEDIENKYGEFTLEQLKNKKEPVTYSEAKYGGIDVEFRKEGITSKEKIEKLKALLLKIEKHVPKSEELETAIKLNDIEMVEKLIDQGVKVPPKLFTLAIEQNNSEIVSFLLFNEYLEIDVNEMDYDYDCCESNLQIAIDNGNVSIVKLLIEKGVDVNYENDGGETPLFNACQVGILNIIKLLVKNGTIISSGHLYGEDKSSFEKFIYLLILSSKNSEIVDFLISKKDVIVNDLKLLQDFYKDYELKRDEYSLFEYAIKKGDILIVKLLIEYEKKETGENLLELSAKYDNPKIFIYLFEMNKFIITDTILNIISFNVNEELINFLLFEVEQYDILMYILQNKKFFDKFKTLNEEMNSSFSKFLKSKKSKNVLQNLLISKTLENYQLDSIYENIEKGLNKIYLPAVSAMVTKYKEVQDEIYLEHYGYEYNGEIPEYDYRNCNIDEEPLVDVLFLIHLLKAMNSSDDRNWLEIKKSISFYNEIPYTPLVKTFTFSMDSKLLFSKREFVNMVMKVENLNLIDFLVKNKNSLIYTTAINVDDEEMPF